MTMGNRARATTDSSGRQLNMVTALGSAEPTNRSKVTVWEVNIKPGDLMAGDVQLMLAWSPRRYNSKTGKYVIRKNSKPFHMLGTFLINHGHKPEDLVAFGRPFKKRVRFAYIGGKEYRCTGHKIYQRKKLCPIHLLPTQHVHQIMGDVDNLT